MPYFSTFLQNLLDFFFMFFVNIVSILQQLKELQTIIYLFLFSKLNNTNINYVNKNQHYFGKNK
jgi:hypothetical protein